MTTLEAAAGWLLVIGVLAAVFGAAVHCSARVTVTRPASPCLLRRDHHSAAVEQDVS